MNKSTFVFYKYECLGEVENEKKFSPWSELFGFRGTICSVPIATLPKTFGFGLLIKNNNFYA